MSIKVITIDFWNTLFDSSGGSLRNQYRQKALIQAIDRYEVVVKQDQFTEAMKASWKFFENIWMKEQRTPHPSETIRFFWEYLKLPEDEIAVDKLVHEFAISTLAHPPKIIEGVKEVIPFLAERYYLGIVSDTGFTSGEMLKKLMDDNDILQYFKVFSFSNETGVSKPQAKAFLTVLEHFQCEPENSLHIGDIEKTDVLGSKNLGMKSIRYSGDPTGNLKEQNPKNSMADVDVMHWNEIPNAIEILDN